MIQELLRPVRKMDRDEQRRRSSFLSVVQVGESLRQHQGRMGLIPKTRDTGQAQIGISPIHVMLFASTDTTSLLKVQTLIRDILSKIIKMEYTISTGKGLLLSKAIHRMGLWAGLCDRIRLILLILLPYDIKGQSCRHRVLVGWIDLRLSGQD